MFYPAAISCETPRFNVKTQAAKSSRLRVASVTIGCQRPESGRFSNDKETAGRLNTPWKIRNFRDYSVYLFCVRSKSFSLFSMNGPTIYIYVYGNFTYVADRRDASTLRGNPRLDASSVNLIIVEPRTRVTKSYITCFFFFFFLLHPN